MQIIYTVILVNFSQQKRCTEANMWQLAGESQKAYQA